jgi:uncharacterized membrane protein
MIDPMIVLTILMMASATYVTRVGGYVFLRNRTLSPRTKTIMESAPGCVLITIVAPDFVTDHPADLIALAVTMAAATRLSVLPTVVIAIPPILRGWRNTMVTRRSGLWMPGSIRGSRLNLRTGT